MTRYLLDTNIVSNLIKPSPSPSLLHWMAAQDDRDLFIASLTLAEIQRGILSMPTGQKRRTLEDWFAGPAGPSAIFSDRILPFDAEAAQHWAVLMADGFRNGRPRSSLDMIIAATAVAHDCVVVTNNGKDFAEIETINPMKPNET